MEIGELKKMLKKSTAVLILEDGDPSLVVVDYATYKEMLGEDYQPPARPSVQAGPQMPVPPSPSAGELELLERINKDILALKEQIQEDEKALEQ